MSNEYDKKLIKKMIYFIEEAYNIMKMIDNNENNDEIRIRYKELKQKIKEEAHYKLGKYISLDKLKEMIKDT